MVSGRSTMRLSPSIERPTSFSTGASSAHSMLSALSAKCIRTSKTLITPAWESKLNISVRFVRSGSKGEKSDCEVKWGKLPLAVELWRILSQEAE